MQSANLLGRSRLCFKIECLLDIPVVVKTLWHTAIIAQCTDGARRECRTFQPSEIYQSFIDASGILLHEEGEVEIVPWGVVSVFPCLFFHYTLLPHFEQNLARINVALR